MQLFTNWANDFRAEMQRKEKEKKTEIMHHLNACAADAIAITANMAATTKFVMKLWWLHIVATCCTTHTSNGTSNTLSTHIEQWPNDTTIFSHVRVSMRLCADYFVSPSSPSSTELFLNRNGAPRSRHKSSKWNRNWFGFLSAWLSCSHTHTTHTLGIINICV